MFKYILRRLVYFVFVFLLVSVIMFTVFKAIPADPVSMMLEGQRAGLTPAQYDALYKATYIKLGLDKPLVVQYFIWLFNFLTGDMGWSLIYKQPVNSVIAYPMLNTVKLNILSVIIVLLITVPLGIYTATKRGGFFDNTVQIATIIGYSLPSFVFALIFIYLFAVRFKIFPISGMATPNFHGTPLQELLDRLWYMCLPIITMTATSLAGITRYVRSTMIEALSEDYIRTARAKGLSEKVVVYSHAFRNALIPFVTIITSWVISIFSGSIVIESMFNYNGIGRLLFTALGQVDYSVVISLNMFYVILTLAGNLIMDLLYGVVDPRVKITK